VFGCHARGPESAAGAESRTPEVFGIGNDEDTLNSDHLPEDQDWISFDVEIESWTRLFSNPNIDKPWLNFKRATCVLYECSVVAPSLKIDAVDGLACFAKQAKFDTDQAQQYMGSVFNVSQRTVTLSPLDDDGFVERKDRLPISTIRAADFLVQVGNRQRLHDWLSKHSSTERKALRKYFTLKKKNRRHG
jgi:hypothetical protein